MSCSPKIIVVGLILAAACAGAAEISIYGTVYGAVTDDFAEGSAAPLPTNIDVGPNGHLNVLDAAITRDGDPMYNFRLEADLGVRAALTENAAANVLFTFDDRKQSRFYRYTLLLSDGDYYLSETPQNRYVYASLEQLDVELAKAAWETDFTLGGYDIRYGHGGYYNGLVNRIDPTSFVAYLDPFGARAARVFGRTNAEVSLGVGLDHQAIGAASFQTPYVTFDVAAEQTAYDLLPLWQTHLLAALPPYWRYYYQRGGYAVEPATARDPARLTLHAGVERGFTRDNLDLYGVVAYHFFPDSPAFVTNPSGGSLLQIYPDFGVRLFTPRLWLRGAALYEFWQANYNGTFGVAVGQDDYLLLFGEPEFFVAENAFIGAGGRFIKPSSRRAEDPTTAVRESQTLSIAALPHFSWVPTEGMKFDLTYEYAVWDPTYDLSTTAYKENRVQKLKMEIEAAF